MQDRHGVGEEPRAEGADGKTRGKVAKDGAKTRALEQGHRDHGGAKKGDDGGKIDACAFGGHGDSSLRVRVAGSEGIGKPGAGDATAGFARVGFAPRVLARGVGHAAPAVAAVALGWRCRG